MFPSPYELYQFIQKKGYIPPMAGQVAIDSIQQNKQTPSGLTTTFVGTGDHLKTVMELDRRNVYKSFYADGPDDCESTWIAGDEDGHGMLLPQWAERLIHADVLVMQEKIDCAIDYLLHTLGKQNENTPKQ